MDHRLVFAIIGLLVAVVCILLQTSSTGDPSPIRAAFYFIGITVYVIGAFFPWQKKDVPRWILFFGWIMVYVGIGAVFFPNAPDFVQFIPLVALVIMTPVSAYTLIRHYRR